MAMVRCPKHKIPYNDSNPRGCPACARQKEGGRVSDAIVMQDLARASQMIKRPSGVSGQELARPSQTIKRPSGVSGPLPALDTPVTQQPRVPRPRFTAAMKALLFLRKKQFLAGGAAAISVLAIALLATSGPKFTIAFSPVNYPAIVRPLPISPNDAVAVMFSAIGPQTPQPNPQARELERYSYGTELVIEAVNGQIYAITFSVPNRSWRGLRVGMEQTNAEGTLALLGTPQVGEPTVTSADTISGFIVYRSLATRPRRLLKTEVRPPNNCFDVEVDLQPRQTGTLRVGKRSYSVIARVGGPPSEWVVTRIRAVSRALMGPYTQEPACTAGEQ